MIRKTVLLFTVFSLAIIGAGAAEARAATLYVSTTGNDRNPGTISEPLATPKRAIDIASPGDTIYFRAGRYPIKERLWVGQSNLTISSYKGERAAIEGGTTEGEGSPSSVFVIVGNHVSLINLEIKGGAYYGIKVDIDRNPSTTGVVIRGCFVHHTGRDAIKTLNADNLLIEDCEIAHTGVRDNNAEGIDSIGSKGVVIRRCYVHDTRTTGIYLKGGARDGLVEGCRIVNAGNSGLLFGQDTDQEYMRDGVEYEAINCLGRNNIIENTIGAGIGTYSGSNIRFLNNTVYDAARTNHAGFYVVMNNRDVRSRQVTFKNNILVMFSERPMFFIVNMADQIVSDSNIYYRPGGEPYKFSQEIHPDTGNYWKSLAEWQRGVGADRRSIIANPRLDTANLCRLSPGSPAIDRGEVVSDVLIDYSGTARPQGKGPDIGAHETSLRAGAAGAGAHGSSVDGAGLLADEGFTSRKSITAIIVGSLVGALVMGGVRLSASFFGRARKEATGEHPATGIRPSFLLL